MSVMNRKMFANREARTKLRDMGGIMSSFPELSSEVQRFQDGQEVRVTGSGMTPANVVPPITYPEWLRMSRREREAAGLPVSPIGGELYFNRLGVGLGLNDPETGEQLPGTVLEQLQEEAANPDPWGFGSFAPTGGGPEARRARAILGEALFGGLRGPAEAAASIPIGAGALIGDVAGTVAEGTGTVASTLASAAGLPGAAESLQDAAEPPEREQPVAGTEDLEMTTGETISPDDGPLLPGEEEQPVAGAEDGEGAPAQVDPDAILAAMQEDLTALGEQDDQTLRERYEDRLQLFQDVFGSDEQTARDRSMALAMIGLAIAAGQSPDAITNIASGALAGLQSMSAQEERRRERGREARGMALESAMGELAAQRDAQAETAAFQREADLRRELAAIGAGGRDGAGGVNLATGNAILQAVQAVAQQLIETGEANNMTEAEPIARQLVLQRLGDFGIGATSALPTAAPEDATPEELALLGGGA
jgi:hypothetical protein